MINTSAFTQAVKLFGYLVNRIMGGVYKLAVTVTDIAFIVAIIVGSVVVHLLGKLRNIFKDSAKVVEGGLWHLWKP